MLDLITALKIHISPDTLQSVRYKLVKLWHKAGLIHYDRQHQRFGEFQHDPLDENTISNGKVDATLLLDEGYLLVATDFGLNLLNLENQNFKRFFHDPEDPHSISSNSIKSLYRDREGTIWIGALGQLNRFDLSTGKFERLDAFSRINTFFEDSFDNLWMTTSRSGLRRYNREEDQFDIYLDSSGILGESSKVWGIAEDQDSLLWITTDVGPINLNVNEATANAFQWDSDFFLPLVHSDGRIIMSHGFGAVAFSPRTQQQERQLPPFIDKLFAYENSDLDHLNLIPKTLPETGALTLNYSENNLAIEYGHADFLSIPNLHFVKYRLENYENSWRNQRGSDKVIYRQLPPGRYTFQVKASTANGYWTERSLPIVILPPWYRTWWAYLIFSLLAIGLLRLYIVYKARKLKAENLILENKVEKRTAELQATQSQLMQSEKMASLGELTAGIAHEIQNPLNFVNNFSEVNVELIDELVEEVKSGKSQNAIELANDIKSNEEKINHHGKRADSIVKGMLQHSRSGSGEKKPTDINVLCDEYMRLAFHGLKARDKSFKANIETHLDSTIGEINVIPEEIGRVILNILNNAFYAVRKKAKSEDSSFKPTVSLTTKMKDSQVVIEIQDNGTGMSPSVQDKVFQPFFTTKPTGEGTGLGMSLSYDIISKGHNGNLAVHSKEGEGTEFRITLPK